MLVDPGTTACGVEEIPEFGRPGGLTGEERLGEYGVNGGARPIGEREKANLSYFEDEKE